MSDHELEDGEEQRRLAACFNHEYTITCGYCVARFFQNLLSSDYVPKWSYDQLLRERNALHAMCESRRVENDYLNTQLQYWKNKVMSGWK